MFFEPTHICGNYISYLILLYIEHVQSFSLFDSVYGEYTRYYLRIIHR
jgi:hypothetical protein